jgi:hypothetical protein
MASRKVVAARAGLMKGAASALAPVSWSIVRRVVTMPITSPSFVGSCLPKA